MITFLVTTNSYSVPMKCSTISQLNIRSSLHLLVTLMRKTLFSTEYNLLSATNKYSQRTVVDSSSAEWPREKNTNNYALPAADRQLWNNISGITNSTIVFTRWVIRERTSSCDTVLFIVWSRRFRDTVRNLSVNQAMTHETCIVHKLTHKRSLASQP